MLGSKKKICLFWTEGKIWSLYEINTHTKKNCLIVRRQHTGEEAASRWGRTASQKMSIESREAGKQDSLTKKKKNSEIGLEAVQWSFAAWQLAEEVWKQNRKMPKKKKLAGEAGEPAGKVVQILER